MMVIKEDDPRKRDKLLNPDGTEMTVEDYQLVVRQMKETNGPPQIANFGFAQTAVHALNEHEKKHAKMKQKDYMKEVINAKRLLPQFAQEEREEFENRLKEKGLWTKAQEKRSKSLRNKNNQDLYKQLE